MMRFLLLTSALLVLAACTAGPAPPVHDTLDTKTGSTVSVMREPLELLTSGYIGTRGGAFAFLGPFEIDQMGTRTLFLWVLLPHDVSSSVEPVIHCNDGVVTLPVKSTGLADLGLAQPPYELPDPWGTQWYFALDDRTLVCFAHARTIALDIPNLRGDPETFLAERPKNAEGFPILENFAERRHTPGL
jgi:hypothetical protein